VIQAQYEQLIIQWQALKAALASMREEDGMATLEVVIIAAGLLAIASALALLISNAYNRRSVSIS